MKAIVPPWARLVKVPVSVPLTLTIVSCEPSCVVLAPERLSVLPVIMALPVTFT